MKTFGESMELPEMKGDRTLIWGDCFNGDTLDTDLWKPWIWNTDDIVAEMSDRTCVFRGGEVDLVCSKFPESERKDGKVYRTPLFLTTKKKMEFRYGYFEVRAKLPCFCGSSAAFWFCSSQKTPRGFSAEVDMVETLGRTDNVVANLHVWGAMHTSFGGRRPREVNSHTFPAPPEQLRTEYHTYSLDWTPYMMEFAVDGEPYCRADITDAGRVNFANSSLDMDAFRLPIHVIISNFLYSPARKLSWGMSGEEDDFPYVMTIDHVALWQKPGEDLYML